MSRTAAQRVAARFLRTLLPEGKTAALVGTDTAWILAISPEQLHRVIDAGDWKAAADEIWGAAEEGDSTAADRMDQIIRENGGAVFHTGADGAWDVVLFNPAGDGRERASEVFTPAQGVQEYGYLPPYGTEAFGRVAAVKGDGSMVGLQIVLPESLAVKFPKLSEDNTPPHVTLLYVGEVKGERQQELVDIVNDILSRESPCVAKLSGLDFFPDVPNDRRIYHMHVDFSLPMASIRNRIVEALKDAGFELKDRSPGVWFPHVTLSYDYGLHEEYRGPIPTGSWEFDTVNIWGMAKETNIILGGRQSKDSPKTVEQVLALKKALRYPDWDLYGIFPPDNGVTKNEPIGDEEERDHSELPKSAGRRASGDVGRTRSGKPVQSGAFTYGQWILAHHGWTRGDHADAADLFRALRDDVVPAYQGGGPDSYAKKRYYDKMMAAHQEGLGGKFGGGWSRDVMEVVEPDENKRGARSPLRDAAKAWKDLQGMSRSGGVVPDRNPTIREDTWAGGFYIEFEGARKILTWTGGGFADLSRVRARPEMFPSFRAAERAVREQVLPLIHRHREDQVHLITGWPGGRTAGTNQKAIVSPHNYHPVKVEPPRAKRKVYPFEGYIDFQGLQIDVENVKGSVRSGVDPDGQEWSTTMYCHYGEIRGTEGTDGDKLDVYVGDNHDSSIVVVVYQHNPWDGKYDEDKVMVGFDSVEEAIGAYKKQYDKPGYYKEGEHLAMPIGQFWRWVKDTRKKGKKVTGAVRLQRGQSYQVTKPGAFLLEMVWDRPAQQTLPVGGVVEYQGKVDGPGADPVPEDVFTFEGFRGRFYPSKWGNADTRYLGPVQDQPSAAWTRRRMQHYARSLAKALDAEYVGGRDKEIQFDVGGRPVQVLIGDNVSVVLGGDRMTTTSFAPDVDDVRGDAARIHQWLRRVAGLIQERIYQVREAKQPTDPYRGGAFSVKVLDKTPQLVLWEVKQRSNAPKHWMITDYDGVAVGSASGTGFYQRKRAAMSAWEALKAEPRLATVFMKAAVGRVKRRL